MNIKNYTSNTPVGVSMGKIEEKLVAIGATSINKKYENKICTGIQFLYYDPKLKQTFPFHLKAQVNEAFEIFWKEIKRPKPETKNNVMEQANRTAWKILQDWVDIQCSMILLGQAEPLQMFLPYMYDINKEETYYDKITNGKIKLQLTNS